MRYNIFGDIIQINTEDKTMTINSNTITFERLEEINQQTKHINRIHKPGALLLYIDYKNNKLSNWNSCRI